MSEAAPLLPAVLVSALLLGLGVVNGGFFPRAWSWASFALVWLLSAVAFIRSRLALTYVEAGALAALTALVGWTLVSALWSSAGSQSVREAERALLYLLAVALTLLASQGDSLRRLLGGVLLGLETLAVYALARYLFFPGRGIPDRFEGYLLFRPVGYANALGVLMAIAVVLAVGFALHTPVRILHSVCAASLVPLLAALYLSASRGAWIALAVATATLIALERDRRPAVAALIALAPFAALAITLSRQAHLQTHSPLFQAHRAAWLGVELVLMACVSGLLAPLLLTLMGRVLDDRRLRGVLSAFGVLGTGVVLTVGVSGRVHLDLTGGNRLAYWHAAWREWLAHPLLGSGAGTFGRYWQLQPHPYGAADAHNLYLETLAELGLPGLALLLLFLAIPVAAALRARAADPMVPAALAAYVAYLVHAGLDWDWEMPVVTLSALICASVPVIACRSRSRTMSAPRRQWMLIPGLAAVATALAELIGNGAISLP